MAIEPKNLTAQFMHQGRGNPPGVTPDSAISNFYPGLEFDLRAAWKHVLEGVELHESGRGSRGHTVVEVEAGGAAAEAGVQPGDRLVSVDGNSLEARATNAAGQVTNVMIALELFNALAPITQKAGALVKCVFRRGVGQISVDLMVRPIFEKASLSQDILTPGEMTQGLCSPWQADYRECGCFYWAASRPDLINVETDGAGKVTQRHDWMQRSRGPSDSYRPDVIGSPEHLSYGDRYREWEKVLKFIKGGKDTE